MSAASAGTAAAKRPPTPSWSASCVRRPLRSSTTSPLVVDTLAVPPSRICSIRTWARRLASAHACCARGRARSSFAARSASVAQRAGGGRGERIEPGRERRADLLGDVDVRVQLVDEVDGDLVADHGVGEHLGARLRPVVGVEHLPVQPDGEQRDEREQARDDDHRDGDPVSCHTRKQTECGPRGNGAGRCAGGGRACLSAGQAGGSSVSERNSSAALTRLLTSSA